MAQSKRTKATSIAPDVRQKVVDRDKWCIFCGKRGQQICHIRPRSRGGLGIPENLVYGCVGCHMMLDQSKYRKEMIAFALQHLSKFYPNFKDEDRYYRRFK